MLLPDDDEEDDQRHIQVVMQTSPANFCQHYNSDDVDDYDNEYDDNIHASKPLTASSSTPLPRRNTSHASSKFSLSPEVVATALMQYDVARQIYRVFF